jgi:LacI family transcriptional regulator
LSALVAYRHRTRPRRDQPILAYMTHWDTRWGWKEHSAHRAFHEGAGKKAAALGYRLEHFWLEEPGLTHRRMSDIFRARGINGLIVASHRLEATEPLDFDWSRLSAVKIDFSPREPQLHLVTNDQRAIVQLAMRQARAAGYRRVGFVIPRWWDEFVDLAWSAGFLAEQQRIEPADRIPILFYGQPQRAGSPARDGENLIVPRAAFDRWLKKHRPDAVVSHGPFVLPRLAELGVAVPDDIAFVETFLEETDGKTAGVRQNCDRVGELAIEILAGQLHQNVLGVPAIPTATLVEGTWFDGASLPQRGHAQVTSIKWPSDERTVAPRGAPKGPIKSEAS